MPEDRKRRWFKMEQQNGELIAANEKLLRELNDLTKRVNALQGGIGEAACRFEQLSPCHSLRSSLSWFRLSALTLKA